MQRRRCALACTCSPIAKQHPHTRTREPQKVVGMCARNVQNVHRGSTDTHLQHPTPRTSELREVVGLQQPVQRLAPLPLVHQVCMVLREVGNEPVRSLDLLNFVKM